MAISKFGQAFRAARNAGKATFMFNGKLYHTRTREEEEARKGPSSSPVSKPSQPESKPRDFGMVTNTITVRATREAPPLISKRPNTPMLISKRPGTSSPSRSRQSTPPLLRKRSRSNTRSRRP